MSRQVRVFRRLVRVLFPQDFRDDYESEMTRTFGAQQRDAEAGGLRALARLWWETIADAAATAPREHIAQLRQDVRYALRMMARTPAFTAVAVLTLAIGIGANTAVFSIVHAVLLRPLPYAHGASVAVARNLLDGARDFGFSNPELLDARERLRSLDVAAFASTAVNLTGHGEPERLQATALTSNALQVLGVLPVLGRTFRAEEELPGHGRVAILTHALWHRLFDGHAAALGRTIDLDGERYTVIGVLPPDFVGPHEFTALERSAVLLPLTLDPAAPRGERGSHFLTAIARPRAGVTISQAQAELDTLTAAFRAEYPGEYVEAYRAALVPLRTEVLGDVQRPLVVMFGAVTFVLLIACANVANLLLARGRVRAREIALRKAIGAHHARLVRQVLTESMVFAAVSGAAGVVLARWMQALIAGSAASIPRLADAGLNSTVLLFSAGSALATAVVFGCLPALQLARTDAAAGLRGGRGAHTPMRRGVRAALVAGQVALALVLLVGAGLLVRSFARLLDVAPGFSAERVLTMRLSVPLAGYESRERVVSFFEQVLDGVRAAPGVAAAGAVSGLPVQAPRGDWDFYMEGETPGPHGSDRPADWQVITPGYIEALNVRLVRGRRLASSDRADSPAVALINETLARTHFSNRDPIGRQIRMSGGDRPWMTIVGVVGDVRQDGLDAPPMPEIYMPHTQFMPFWRDSTLRAFTVVVRTDGDPAAAAAIVRREVAALDPHLPLASVMTMEEVLARSVSERRLHTLLLGVFAGVALLLALIGTYGVLAYQVTERTRELGVRMALGAGRHTIVRMVLRQGMAPACAGVLIGLGGAALLTRLLRTLLYETEPLDPTTFGATAGVLILAALAACWFPARRATLVDPSTALRTE